VFIYARVINKSFIYVVYMMFLIMEYVPYNFLLTLYWFASSCYTTSMCLW